MSGNSGAMMSWKKWLTPCASATRPMTSASPLPRLAIRHPPPGGRPVLPRHVLEAHHQVLGIRALGGKALDYGGQNLLLHLHASPGSQKYFHQHEVVGPARAHVGKRRIVAEVLRIQLEDTVNA